MANIIKDVCGSAFRICDYIDKGSFSKVYTLEACLNKKRFAGKFISKEKLQKYGIKHKVFDEIRIHQKLRHRNIVQFLTHIELENHIIIVLEYCSKYSMVNIVHTFKTLNVNESKYFMLQVVSAVEYLHKHHIVHRDLKLGNLFLNSNLEIKLGDFGLAVVVEYEGQRRFSRCGTPNYIAPEVINGVGHGYEVDVWALGCILHTMLDGTPPFQGHNTASTYNKILRGEYMISPHTEPAARAFIESTLQLDPKRRPTVEVLGRSEFLTSSAIRPEPPVFCIDGDEKLSLVKSDKQDNVSRINYANLVGDAPRPKENPKDCFISLSNWLSDIKQWKESHIGEFLSENYSMHPLVWVNSWIDYTNSYGFAYQLNNTNYGVIFNDRTRIILENEEKRIKYVKNDGSVIVFQINNIPTILKKKVEILVKCGKYMNQELLKAHELKEPRESPRESELTTEVFAWTRGGDKVAMFLTNGSIQVNFTDDHTKIIVCAFTKTVTIIENPACMKTLKLDHLQRFGCTKNLKKKLIFVVKYIDVFLSD